MTWTLFRPILIGSLGMSFFSIVAPTAGPLRRGYAAKELRGIFSASECHVGKEMNEKTMFQIGIDEISLRTDDEVSEAGCS